MSKNTLSSQFRKIDIDQYNEDLFKDEDNQDAVSPTIGFDEREINNLMAQGRHGDALKHLLSRAPINSKNQLAKDTAFSLMMQLLNGVRANEIDKIVDQLDNDHIDILMKYIYRGFETPPDGNSAHLLSWHEKTYNKGGVGCIVRVLTDKRKV